MKVVRVVVLLIPVCVLLPLWAWRHSKEDVPPREAFEQALEAMESGDWERVRLTAERLGRDPEYAEHARLLSATDLLRNGRPEAALEVLNTISPSGELRLYVLSFRGEAFYRLGRLAEAEVVFRGVTAEFPDQPVGHRWLGAIYYDVGAMNESLAALDRLATLAPDDYQPHWLRGVIFFDFERYADSASAYRAALNRHPPPGREALVVAGLVRSLVKGREYAAAAEVFQEYPSIEDAKALAAVVEANWSLGDIDQARGLLQRAAGIDPNDRDVRYWQAKFALHNGDTEQAVDHLRAILRDDAHDSEACYQLAMAYRQLGHTDEYAAAMAQKEDSDALIQRLHDLNLQALADPADPVVRDECAELCEALGKPELALMWRRAARACREGQQTQDSRSGSP